MADSLSLHFLYSSQAMYYSRCVVLFVVLCIHYVDSVDFLPGVNLNDAGTVCQNSQKYVARRGKPSEEKTPYQITTNMTEYIPGQPVKVTIAGPIPIQGFTLQARRLGTMDIVGNFMPPSDARPYSCDAINDTLVGWYTEGVDTNQRTFTWLPPDEDSGSVQFIGTIFKNENTFWENIQSDSFRKGFAAIDVAACGKTKGCFRYTQTKQEEDCVYDTCQYLVTFKREGNVAHFEMTAVAGWVAIGFSSDDQMGGDDVFMCVRTGNTVEVRHYFIDFAGRTPNLKPDNPLYNHQSHIGHNGRISCRFDRPLKVSNDQYSVDLNNDWFQLYAWGPVSESGTIMRHTLERPPTSKTKLILTSGRDHIVSGACITYQSVGTSFFALLIFFVYKCMLYGYFT